MYIITMLRRHFELSLEVLLRQSSPVIVSHAGHNRTAAGLELLCRPVQTPAAAAASRSNGDHVLITIARTSAELFRCGGLLAGTPFRGDSMGSRVGVICIGIAEACGQISGTILHPEAGRSPLDALTLIGPGMPSVSLTGPTRDAAASIATGDRYSRTVGALGGDAIWGRFRSLQPCVVGVGRTGSLVATTLAQMGVRGITLVDPDGLEPHNLDMPGMRPGAIGAPKVMAVAEHLRMLRPDLAVTVIPHRVTAAQSIAAIKGCAVLFSCVDNDAARLATASLATLYLKPLVDVGTGVFLAPEIDGHSGLSGVRTLPSQRRMGADIRCLIPGEACLLCCGGLVHEDEARETLRHPPLSTAAGDGWTRQRAGSLLSLNQIAAHFGVQMWLDLVAGVLREPLWARVEFDDTGRVTVRYLPCRPLTDTHPCALCRKAGLGDAGLGWRER